MDLNFLLDALRCVNDPEFTELWLGATKECLDKARTKIMQLNPAVSFAVTIEHFERVEYFEHRFNALQELWLEQLDSHKQ